MPGLTAHAQPGEVVALRCPTRDVAAALVETLSGRRQAQYGLISVGASTSRRIAPRTPRGLVTVELDRVGNLDPSCRAIVVDAGTAPAGASVSEVHVLAGGGAAVLVVTADEQLAAAADRQVEVEPLTDPAASAVQDPIIALADLTELVTATLCAEGVAPRRAALVARVLVDADARGHFSHGVGLLPMYVDRIRAGGIDPVADPQWVSEMGVVKVLDAQGGFGQVAAELAAQTVAEDAAVSGIAAVGVRGNNHIGMLAAYRDSFTRHGVVGLVFNVSGPSVAAPGAGRATLGNDAVCLVAPLEGSRPFIVDFATGIVASGKIRDAAHRGRPVPPEWLVDRRGRPTTDPHQLDAGGAVPVFGGYKGLGVALITEVLAGVLAGATISPRVHKQRAEPDHPMDCSQMFIAFSPRAFGDPPIHELVDELREAVVRGYLGELPDVHLPEQQETAAEERAHRDGVRVPRAVVDQLGWDVGAP
ncbi:Ldh family oxidoreductase [Aeromicrobium fastidiosum]|uniref:Ldh family oxidoreductase n=1 Tax=Aeromicrobium fastidiosum TaxID=52699 RepID=UPI00165FF472|nr:Ldh family oxidoreductase [Aeromicrobium fastidiosum]MBP2390297.1 LDH2 family malate/lactate/ureidoglycolate dehydrogenase [Aeromicrobium fastidiosum]